MNHQALFSSKDKSKIQIVSSAAIFLWCFKGEVKLLESQHCHVQNAWPRSAVRRAPDS